MTTPQDPQNPYAGGTEPPAQPPAEPPPPPAEPTPSPAEPTPSPAEPTPLAQPPYGEPQPGAPVYGQPGPAQPTYGQPQYGQPQYAQPAYGQQPAYGTPTYPVAPPNDQPSKAMAITALILAILFCVPLAAVVAIVLGVIVLRRGKDGRNHGRGLALTAIIISVVLLLAQAALIYGLTQVDWDEFADNLVPVEGLETGECFNAGNLTDEGEEFVEDITEVECDTPHDAEVLATKTLTADEAENYSTNATMCTDLLTTNGVIDKVGPDMDFTALTWLAEPNAGDKLVCVTYRLDGTKLEAPL